MTVKTHLTIFLHFILSQLNLKASQSSSKIAENFSFRSFLLFSYRDCMLPLSIMSYSMSITLSTSKGPTERNFQTRPKIIIKLSER
jgi:hypothetical protein